MKNKERDEVRDFESLRILREKQVHDLTGLSRVTRWRLQRLGEFPRKVQLTSRCIGWLETEVIEWLKRRAEARDE